MDCPVICRHCLGRGWRDRIGGYRIVCPRCGGTRFMIVNYRYEGQMRLMWRNRP